MRKKGFTLAQFKVMLCICWVRPVNSTHEWTQHPPPPQGMCPEPDQPTSCWPSGCLSSVPVLAPDPSYLVLSESLLWVAFCFLTIIFVGPAQAAIHLVWKARSLASSLTDKPGRSLWSYWPEGSQNRTNKKKMKTKTTSSTTKENMIYSLAPNLV